MSLVALHNSHNNKEPRGRYTARLLRRLPTARFRRFANQSTKPEIVAYGRNKIGLRSRPGAPARDSLTAKRQLN
jgi:hypothetical protein